MSVEKVSSSTSAKPTIRNSLGNDPIASLNVITFEEITFRLAAQEDVSEMIEMIEEETLHFFGNETLEVVLENCLFSYVLESKKANCIVGFISFQNYPSVRAIPHEYWLETLTKLYNISGLTYENVLFVNYLLVDVRFDPQMFKKVLIEIFLRESKLKYICTIAPPNSNGIYPEIFALFSVRMYPIPELIAEKKKKMDYFEPECQCLFICHRYKILPRMRFRKALPEDNDDVVEIINQKTPHVREIMGDYYIAEQVLEEDSSQSIIVAEIANVTVGILWLNTNVDLKKLNANFELSSFGHLTKPDRGDDYTSQVVYDIVKLESETFFNFISPWSHHSMQDQNENLGHVNSNNLHSHNLFEESFFSMVKPSQESACNDDSLISLENSSLIDKWHFITSKLNDKKRYYKIHPTEFTISMQSNAFAIQLIGLDEKIDERRMYDLLAASYALHTDKDYCILTVDTVSALHRSLLPYFVHVIHRPDSQITESLYIAHRSAVLEELRISHLEYEDLTEIEKILCFHSGNESRYPSEAIMEIIFDVLENPYSTKSFLLVRSNGLGVGFIVLGQSSQMDILMQTYDFEIYCDTRKHPEYLFGEIMYLMLLPLFDWLWAFILREVQRLTGYNYFYYAHLRNKKSVNMLLSNMFPLEQKSHVQIHTTNGKLLDKQNHKMDLYSVHFQTVRLSQNRRSYVDMRIVVIGYDATCKAFLKSIIFSERTKNLKFCNITVIVRPGIMEAEYNDFQKHCTGLIEAQICNLECMQGNDFRTWVNFISSNFTNINRNEKCVILNDSSNRIHYDVLFLFCGTDFGIPKQVPDSQTIPINYAQMNTVLDGIILFHKIQVLKMENQNDIAIVIYGNSLPVHGCVNFMLNNGIQPDCVHLVLDDAAAYPPGAFDDEFVEETVFRTEVALGVRIYKNFNFVRWNTDEKGGVIRSIVFQSKFKCLTLPCSIFICYDSIFIDRLTKRVIFNSGLNTFHESILINRYCQTSDLHIFAAGKFTQYTPDLLASKFGHKFCNLGEIGTWLAENLFRLQEKSQTHDLARFNKPIKQQIRLCNNLFYTSLREPGPYLPRDTKQLLHNYGTDFVTGWHQTEPNPDDVNYCYINICEKGLIRTIVCLSKKYENLDIFDKIFGKHEALLNSLKLRYHSGRIKCLLEFFNQPWINVILHSNFQKLQSINHKLLLEVIASYRYKNENLDENIVKKILLQAKSDQQIEANLLRFIKKYPRELHMFYLPDENCL